MSPSQLPLYDFSGSDSEIGFQQGHQCGAAIRGSLDVVAGLDALKKAKPAFLPKWLFVLLAKRRLSRPVLEDVRKHHPGMAERFQAMGEGAQVSIRDILFLQSLEMLIGNPQYATGGCTTVALGPEFTSTNEVVVAKNFDYLPPLSPFQIACVTKPKEGNRCLSFKMAPLPGTLDGMNEHGLVVMYNLAFSTDKADCHVPQSILLQEALERCRSTAEAVEFLSKAKVGGHAALLTIADREGDIRTIEISPRHVAVRDAKEGRLVNANHYRIAEMQRYEVPKDAIHSEDSTRKGTRVHGSSEQRHERAQRLVSEVQKVDEVRIISILRDHGQDSAPSANTICMHSPYAQTMRSMVFYPRRGIVKALHGSPCQTEYAELAL